MVPYFLSVFAFKLVPSYAGWPALQLFGRGSSIISLYSPSRFLFRRFPRTFPSFFDLMFFPPIQIIHSELLHPQIMSILFFKNLLRDSLQVLVNLFVGMWCLRAMLMMALFAHICP